MRPESTAETTRISIVASSGSPPVTSPAQARQIGDHPRFFTSDPTQDEQSREEQQRFPHSTLAR